MTRPTISFRLTDEHFDALVALATRHDESPGQYVKRRWEAMMEPHVAGILAAPLPSSCQHERRNAKQSGVEVCVGCTAIFGADGHWRVVDHDEEGKIRIRLLADPPVLDRVFPVSEHAHVAVERDAKLVCKSCGEVLGDVPSA